jgi:hypothetical protein
MYTYAILCYFGHVLYMYDVLLGTYVFQYQFYTMYNMYSRHILYVGVTVGIRAGRILDLAMKYYKYFFLPHMWVVIIVLGVIFIVLSLINLILFV